MSTPRANNLDMIRFVAAGAVIYGHAFPLNGALAPGFLSNSVQTVGVKIFFMLSGFLIAQSWASDPHVLRFAARRALRLFPALALVLVLTTFVVGPLFTTLPLEEYFQSPAVWSYLQNFRLFISYGLPGVFTTNPYPNAVNGSLWSLPVEVCMYVLVPPVMTLGLLSKRPRAVLWAVTVVSVLASAVVVHLRAEPLMIVFYGTSLRSLLDVAPFFAVGALAFVSGWHRMVSAQAALLVLLVAVMFPGGNPVVDELMLTVVIAFLVLGLGFATEPRFSTVGRFGDISYGLYLYGFVVQQTVAALAGKAMVPQLNAAISVVVSSLLAFMSWHLVEKNALKLRPKNAQRGPVVANPAETAGVIAR